MNILKSIWSNFIAASLAMIGAALVHLLVWGEYLKGASTAWLLVFFVVFVTIDLVKWTVSKYRGDV
jgi:K+-transporting ATPase A subunit